jgi:hypothetical protein
MKAAYNAGSNFCRQGQFIKGTYIEATVEGKVLESKVKYGGKVQHRLLVTKGYYMPCLKENRPVGGIVLVDEDEVIYASAAN